MVTLQTPIHVLMVAPRPNDRGPAPALDGSEALHDALEVQGEELGIEWLWPPTLAALASRLSDDLAPKVGIVCLDALCNGEIALEDEAGATNQTSPADLAEVLHRSGVALVIAILHGAPQTADAPDAPDAAPEAIAEELHRAGGLHVLLLDAALAGRAVQQTLRAFAAGLLARESLGAALESAQRGLETGWAYALRLSASDREVELSSVLRLWIAGADEPLLRPQPASAEGADTIVRFPTRMADRGAVDHGTAPGADLKPAWASLAQLPEPGGLPPEPAHGFVGRAAEWRALERALDEDQAGGPVWVHGYTGIGKTTLLAHVGRWLVRTGRFSQVVYTDFSGGGLPEQALYDVGVRLLGEAFTLAPAGLVAPTAAGGPASAEVHAAALERIEAALARTSTLMIWDNLEALLPSSALAGEGAFTLARESLAELWNLAERLSRLGGSRVCLLSDTPDRPQESGALSDLALSLQVGLLAHEDAVDLMGQLWRTARLARPSGEQARALVGRLGGQPLALGALAPIAAQLGSLQALERGLEAILPGYPTGEARLRNGALELCLELLMRELGEARSGLVTLGLFARGFMEPLGLRAVGFEQALWERAKEALIAAGLAGEQRLQGYTVPYIWLHPGLRDYLTRRLGGPQRDALSAAYEGTYAALLQWLADHEQRSPAVVRALVRRELPNLRRVLSQMLAKQKLSQAVAYGQQLGRFMATLGFAGEREQMAARLGAAAQAALPQEGPLARPGVQLLLSQADQLVSAGQLPQAATLLQQLVARMSQEEGLAYKGDEAAYDRGVVLHRLGRCVSRLGRPDAALAAYTQGLELVSGLSTSEAVRAERLGLLQDLAEACLSVGQLDRAEEYAQRGLDLAQQLNNRGALGALHRSQALALAGRDELSQARAQLETALGHFEAAEDMGSRISTWEQLGLLARQARDQSEAVRCFEQGLTLARQGELPLAEAQLLRRLASATDAASDLVRAQELYTQAIEIYQAQNQPPALAATQLALAEMLLRYGQPARARPYAEAARAIVDGLGPGAQPWEAYALLQRIAAAEGDERSAARWRVRAQHAFARSPAAQAVRDQWRPLIDSVARTGRGAALDLQTVEAVEKLEATQQWQPLAAVLWRILGGECGPELYETLDHVQAAIVRATLEAIERPEAEEGQGGEQEPAPSS